MKNTKIFILGIFMLLSVLVLNAQQANTMFYMDRVFQSQTVNVAASTPHKVQVSGLIVPIFGQLPPALYLNYANNSFNYNHIIHKGEGLKADSLVVDLPLFMDKLRKTTNIRSELRIDYFNLAVRSKNDASTITFSVADRIQGGFSLPYDFFEFAINGNLPYMREGIPHDLSNLSANFTAFREVALGFQSEMSDKFSVGARMKLLFGLADVSTKIDKLVFTTNPDNYFITAEADMKIRKSTSLFEASVAGDSLTIKSNSDEDVIKKTLLNFGNFGIGIDLGVQYNINEKLSTYFSVTDFGFINWGKNTQVASALGQYEFEGVEFGFVRGDGGGLSFGLDSLRYSSEKIVDTLVTLFDMQLDDNNYMSWLNANIHLGATYQLHPKIGFGFLYRGEIYKKSYMQSVTISANSNINHWLSLHLNYSYMNNYGGDMGLGLSLRLGFMTWYMATDNVLGFVLPQKAKNINLRMGCNLTFGHPKKELKTTTRL